MKMNVPVLALIWFSASLAVGEQLTMMVQYQQSIEVDEATQTTNTVHRYVFSAPQAIGQLQDAISFVQTNAPSSLTVSNAIAPRVLELRRRIGKLADTVTVVMPP